MKRDFDTLAAIGATTAGGVHRPAFSDSHFEAGNWFRMRAGRIRSDIRVSTDATGNQMTTFPSITRVCNILWSPGNYEVLSPDRNDYPCNILKSCIEGDKTCITSVMVPIYNLTF